MAFRRTSPAVILDVLVRRAAGASKSRISIETGMSRKTVARYITLALREGWTPCGADPTPELAACVERSLRPGRRSRTAALLFPLSDEIKGRLKLGRALTDVYADLRARGIDVSYSSLHRFVINHL